jgi:hypothetical protein
MYLNDEQILNGLQFQNRATPTVSLKMSVMLYMDSFQAMDIASSVVERCAFCS